MKEHDLTGVLSQITGGGQAAAAGDWREYYHAVRERLWMVILLLVLGGIGAAMYLSQQQTKFKARSVLFLEQEQSRVFNDVKSVREEQIRSLDMINTIVDLLGSYSFALRVTERLKLPEEPRFTAGLIIGEGRRATAEESAAALTSMVTAAYRRNTRLIDIFVVHANPGVATTLANAYSDEYLRYVREKRTEATREANRLLFDERENLSKKLLVSEEAMQSFRVRERDSSIETMQQSAELKKQELTSKITILEQKTDQLEADLKIARANTKNTEILLRLPSVLAEPKIARLTEAIAELERQIRSVAERYRPNHPTYKNYTIQRDSLVADRRSALAEVVAVLENEQQRYQGQYDELKKTYEEHEEKLLKILGKSVEFNRLKRDSEADRLFLESVQSRIKEIDLTKGQMDLPVRVHENAIGAGQLAASIPKAYALGIFLGLAAGIGLAIALHLLDSSLKTVEQVEQISGLPVLAAVERKTGRSANARTLDVVTQRAGTVAESFRSLRASVAMLAASDTKRSFLFTSAQPAEGKTFCSTNFAASLCQQGYRTLLIDADLRKPSVSPVFFGDHRKPGLSDVLAGRVTVQEAIIPSEIEGLSILTAGGRSPDPAELLAARRMRELIEELGALYDRVVIDTAPTLAVSDALLIAPYVDVACLVLRSGSTPRKALVRAVKSLTDIGCRPAGIVFNFVPTGAGASYYSSGKNYGAYGAKGVYGAGSK